MEQEENKTTNSETADPERDADFSKLEEGTAGGSGDELAQVKTELADTKSKYLRALADADNMRKRHIKERGELLKYQGDAIIADLLPVLDNLERAAAHVESDPHKVREGLELITKMFIDALKKWDIRPETAVGQEFDPQKHQAISKIPAHDAKPGTVLNELKKAFFYKDKILRHGEVVVAAEKPTDDNMIPDNSE